MLIRHRFIAAAFLAALAPLAHAQAQAAGLLTQHSISTDTAIALATAALQRCRADGYTVSITVLNQAGRTAVALSDNNASPHTLENSGRKAFTAFTTRGPSGEVAKRGQPGLSAFLLLKNVTALEGGLPILAGTEIVGAVGVSGAPGGDKDAACAQAGIDHVAKLLRG